jgi:4-hydroxy-tetrahydrodipicolinate synthase
MIFWQTRITNKTLQEAAMFKGVFTALVTPFNEEGSIDKESLKKLIDYQIAGGVQGLVPMGTTGESPALSHEEHIEVIHIVVKRCDGKVPVIAGTGSNSTREAINLSRRAKDAGVSATLHVAPYYNKPTQEGLLRHYNTIAEEVDIPIIVYNIPGRTGINVDNETMLLLAENERIVGVKDATGNLTQLMELLSRKPDSFTVLSGDDNMTLPMIAIGANGVISVAGNLIPEEMNLFVKAALSGKPDEAREHHYRLLPLFKGLFIETNPIPIKAALALKGMIKEIYRLPMCPLGAENRAKLVKLLKKLEIT